MKKASLISGLTLLAVSGVMHSCGSTNSEGKSHQEGKKPNIILLFTDDQGYADVSRNGGKIKTPNIDNMAAEGMLFTDFYVPSPSCAPSRSALMTGSYPARSYVSPNMPDNAVPNLVKMKDIPKDEVSAVDWSFMQEVMKKYPEAKLARHLWGLRDSDVTMSEMLKNAGYTTMMYGKWHLGEAPKHHPTEHGFDGYFGVPQSVSVRAPSDNNPWMIANEVFFPMQPFFVNDSITEYQADSSLLTKRYTEHAIDYIKTHKDTSFFIHMAYAMPHVPIGASRDFLGKSGQGLYGDVITEIDWSVGEILKTLKELGLEDNTLVVFTSDNGPWLAYGDYAGSAAPLREGKGTSFEGGVREPGIMWWPGKIKAGRVCTEPAMTIDLYPTFAEIAGGKLPDYPIDGKSILSLMTDPNAKSPQEAYYFFDVGNIPKYEGLIAIRKGDWKLFFPYNYKTAENIPLGKGGEMVSLPEATIPLSLFNLHDDLGERNNVAAEHPKIVKELKRMALDFEKDILANQRDVDYILKDQIH